MKPSPACQAYKGQQDFLRHICKKGAHGVGSTGM